MARHARSAEIIDVGALVRGAGGAVAAVALFFGALAIDPAGIVNGVAAFGDYSSHSSFAYGEGARRTVDVYRPVHGALGAPVAVFLYGGGWNSGKKEDYRFVGAALAERGVIAIIPDYRIYPEVRFPSFLEDAAQAVRWSKDNAANFGGDPNRLILIGHSAGAYMAAMLALDPRWLAPVGLVPQCDITGWVGLAGPYDLSPDVGDRRRAIFESAKDEGSVRPDAFVDPKSPPALLIAGADDTTVRPQNTIDLARRIRGVGGRVETLIYPGMGHRTLIGAFSPIFGFRFPVLHDVTNFVFKRASRQACGSADRS
ncbi:MAG: alpha/beta hydrolase [Roseiarcus sp.]|jgi:acetyl esterase/lipase